LGHILFRKYYAEHPTKEGRMIEIVADYKVETKAKQVGVVWCRCPQCSMVYGFEIEGGEYLRVGKLKLVSLRAFCGDCGYTIWWYSSDRHMKRITKHGNK